MHKNNQAEYMTFIFYLYYRSTQVLYLMSGFVLIFLHCIDFSWVFLPHWEKRTVFHSSLQAENYFGQVFSSQKSKSFVTIFYCMSTSPVPKRVMVCPIEGQPCLECSTVITSWKLLASVWCPVLETSTVYIFYSDVAWDQGVKSPGEVEHQEALFEVNLQCQCYFKCSSSSTACIWCTVPETSTVFIPSQVWPKNKVSRVPEGIYHLQVFIWNCIPVQFKFCS